MNKFEKQLEKWNNGVLRGAQAKLAKLLKVSTATTALWATGKRNPSKGYVAQMAELFDMDVYSVVKLFERPVFYPDPSATGQSLSLREKDTYLPYIPNAFEEESPAKSNSVRIAFLANIPLKFPLYDEDDVIEWWSVPRRYALGAKYIVSSAQAGFDTTDPDDICLIKPTNKPETGKVLLVKNKNGSFQTTRNREADQQIIGVITRRIQSVK